MKNINWKVFRNGTSLFLASVLVLICTFLLSLSPRTVGIIDHFKVGDVVYSILPQEDFSKLHGDGWMLMDGSAVADSADLKRFFPNQLRQGQYLPDGRGLFIRGMNVGRNDGGGEDNNPNRPVGEYQSDAVGTHNHEYTYFRDFGWSRLTGGDGAVAILHNPGPFTTSNNGNGASETRPKNIAMYTYIKVDER